MNGLSLSDTEATFLGQHKGFFDTKRNMIIVPEKEWETIQKELNSLSIKKIKNEEDFNSKEKEYNEKIYNTDFAIKNEEKQLQEKLTRIQNENVSLQLRINQNEKEALERKYNQNEEKIKNEKITQTYFLNQSKIAMDNKIEQLNRLRNLDKEERELRKRLLEINEEIINIQANERKSADLSLMENKQRRTILEVKIEDLERKIKRVSCILCNVNISNVFYDTCKHLGCCADCMADKFKNTTTSSKLLCPICNAVNTQSYQIMIP